MGRYQMKHARFIANLETSDYARYSTNTSKVHVFFTEGSDGETDETTFSVGGLMVSLPSYDEFLSFVSELLTVAKESHDKHVAELANA